MGSHVAFSGSPLGTRLREDQAEFAGGEFLGLLAAVAGIHNGMAGTAIKLAAVLVHEKTLNAFFGRCTNHGNHVLSS